MFVLTTTAKAVSESSDPNLGKFIFVALIIILITCVVEEVKYTRWKKDFDKEFRNKHKSK